MRRIVFALLLAPLLWALVPSAHAAPDFFVWNNPGHHPLAPQGSNGRTQAALACAENGLGMSAYDKAQFRKIVEQSFRVQQLEQHPTRNHKIIRLKDGMHFLMTYKYKGCRVEHVKQEWNPKKHYDWRAEEVRIREPDGTVHIYVRPFICNNWSLLIHPSSPPCYAVVLNYQHNPHVMAQGNLKTLGWLAHHRQWSGSAQRHYLEGVWLQQPNTRFAFVEVHIDFPPKHLKRLQKLREKFKRSPCTGVHDSTGFHHEVDWQCQFCGPQGRGHWPNPGVIKALKEARGVQLPQQEPQGVYVFPCAQGKCVFSMPHWAAKYWMIFCVNVPMYPLDLHGYRGWVNAEGKVRGPRAFEDFDVVTGTEGVDSFRRGVRHDGDIVLSTPGGLVKKLAGQYSYTEPGTY